MQDLVNQTFTHYHIERHLARGGMSNVYLARDIRNSQLVAIKMVHKNAQDYSERFKREVKANAAIQHKHILPALDYGEHDSWYYLVTPYIAQGTLDDHLKQGPLTVEEAGNILEQINDALQYAHDQGILHRDIKASNVLIGPNNYVYLADFGLVKSASDEVSLTMTGYMIGTPEYMAPELIDKEASRSSDIYALGILLYQMLTGNVPFKATTPLGTIMKHIQEQPIPPTQLNNAIPQEVEQVIMQALAKDPTRRFTSARALALAYQQASGQADTTIKSPAFHSAETVMVGKPLVGGLASPNAPAAPTSAQEMLRRLPKEILALLAILALLLLLVGSFAVSSAITNSSQSQPTQQAPAMTSTPTLEPSPTPPPHKGKGKHQNSGDEQ